MRGLIAELEPFAAGAPAAVRERARGRWLGRMRGPVFAVVALVLALLAAAVLQQGSAAPLARPVHAKPPGSAAPPAERGASAVAAPGPSAVTVPPPAVAPAPAEPAAAPASETARERPRGPRASARAHARAPAAAPAPPARDTPRWSSPPMPLDSEPRVPALTPAGKGRLGVAMRSDQF
jgi:hypothetical protein